MKKSEDLIKYGKRLKEYRLKNNLTQAQLAEKANLSVNFIGMIERGERNTITETIFSFAKIFNVSLEDFFKGL